MRKKAQAQIHSHSFKLKSDLLVLAVMPDRLAHQDHRDSREFVVKLVNLDRLERLELQVPAVFQDYLEKMSVLMMNQTWMGY